LNNPEETSTIPFTTPAMSLDRVTLTYTHVITLLVNSYYVHMSIRKQCLAWFDKLTNSINALFVILNAA